MPLWRNEDSLALGASAARRPGSSPGRGTDIYNWTSSPIKIKFFEIMKRVLHVVGVLCKNLLNSSSMTPTGMIPIHGN